MRNIIDKYSRRPFRYGADCCAFVGECVEANTGCNPMERFTYSTEDEANQIISEFGDLEAAITATLGEPHNDEPKNGDVCVFPNAGRQIAGIVYKNRIVARTQSGVMDYPLDWALNFWEVK